MKLLPALAGKDLAPAGPISAGRASSNPRPVIISGLVVIAVTFFGFGLWAALVPLAKGAHVMGQVIAASQRKTIQHFEGGLVKEILVREGDRVKPGDALIRLDETQARAGLDVLRGRRMQEQVIESRLIAERDGAARIAWPTEFAKVQLDARTKDAMADQSALFVARKKEFDGQINSLQERTGQLRRQLLELNQQLSAYQQQHKLMFADAEAMRILQRQGFETIDRVRGFEREVERLGAESAARRTSIAENESQIQAAELQIFQIRDSFQRQVLSELRDSRARLTELDDQITVAQDINARTTIRAPAAGQVVGLTVHTVGGVIRPTDTICFIAPENERLLIEAKVKIDDADVVEVGMRAEIRFVSLPRRAVPLLTGKVLSFATDTLTDPTTRETYYLTRVEANPGELEKLKQWNVMAGMPVEVLIVAGERTLLDYLVAPIEDLFGRALRED